MRKEVYFFLMAACLTMTTVLLPQRAYADSVTFTGQTSITVAEDGTQSVFFYTLTNNSGADLSVLSIADTNFVISFSGDPSDTPQLQSYGFGLGGATCGNDLANGSSCTLAFLVQPFNDLGETDGDSGTVSDTLGVSWSGAAAPLDLSVSVTVADLPVATPEPSSLLLLGTGFLGLMRLRRKRSPGI